MNKYNVKSAPSRKSLLAAVKNFEKSGKVTCIDKRKGIMILKDKTQKV